MRTINGRQCGELTVVCGGLTVFVGIRNDQAGDQYAEDVEDQDTVEDTPNGFGDIATGRFGLGCGDGDEFHPLEGECGLNENTEDREEST